MQIATKESKLCPSTPQLQKDDNDTQQTKIKKKKLLKRRRKQKKQRKKSYQIDCTSKAPQWCSVPMPQQTMSQHYRFAKP